MVERPRSNIEIVFADWIDAMRRGDVERMASALAPDAVHEGVLPGLRCSNRAEIMSLAGPRANAVLRVEALELAAAGDRVVMSVRGPGIGPPVPGTDDETYDQACVVFTLDGGRITHMQDFLHRQDALDAAGVSSGWK
jgi:hypothetical protein